MRKQFARSFSFSLISTMVLGLGSLVASAQTATPAPPATGDQPPASVGENEKGEKANSYQQFEHFLRTDPQASEQIKKNPELLNDPKFLSQHPGLDKYMQTHPNMAAEAKADPAKLMQQTHQAAKKHADYHKEHQQQPKPNPNMKPQH